jgi:hypothetical protein
MLCLLSLLQTSESASAPVNPNQATQPTTRLQRGISKPKQYTGGTVRWCMTATASSKEPNSVDEALNDPRWVSAMDAEHQALLKNNTWHLVSA